jgi:hypothetical protein
MNGPLTPSERRILDAFAAPALPAGFAERILAETAIQDAPLPSPVPRRARGRGWRRMGLVASGVAGFGLMSAAAAASGLFGEAARETVRSAPVIGPIIVSVAPEKPKPAEKQRAAPKAAASASKPVTPPPVTIAPLDAPPASAVTPNELRQQLIAERMAERIEQRRKWRQENGLPPDPVRPRDIAQRLRDLPPEEREAVIARLRQIRAEREAAWIAANGGKPLLTPEERAARRQFILERRAARRAAMLEREAEALEPPASPPPGEQADQ